MLFSEHFEIENADDYDWFDPHLSIDTPLFVDPFLIFEGGDTRWEQAHDKVMDYFQLSFELLAKCDLNRSHQYFHRALKLMEFPEPREFRLGFSSNKIEGSGSGGHLARLVIDSMCEAIKRGTDNIKHFEELGVLVEGINRDRISDITCNLLKSDFIEYTQESCLALGVPLQKVKVPHSSFSKTRNRWIDAEWNLPVDDRSVPIVLVPKRFLGDLPALSTDSWKEFLDSNLRDDLNLHISGSINKKDIIKIARSSPGVVREWVSKKESDGAAPYDIENDPKLRVKWYRGAKDLVDAHPLDNSSIETEEDLHSFIEAVLKRFKHYIEEQGGWRLLWDSNHANHVPEENIQLLLKAVLDGYCRRSSLSLDREVELGRGPVDFVISSSRSVRTLIEVKKIENGHFWNGFSFQLPSYLRSDEKRHGWMLVVRHSDTRPMRSRWKDIPSRLVVENKKEEYLIETICVDGRPKESASKIRSDSEGNDEDPPKSADHQE